MRSIHVGPSPHDASSISPTTSHSDQAEMRIAPFRGVCPAPEDSHALEPSDPHPFASVDMTFAPTMAGPLPYDILGRVLSYVVPDVAAMNALCLVCRGWGFYAERMPQWRAAIAERVLLDGGVLSIGYFGPANSARFEHVASVRDDKRRNLLVLGASVCVALATMLVLAGVSLGCLTAVAAVARSVAYIHVAAQVVVQVALIAVLAAVWGFVCTVVFVRWLYCRLGDRCCSVCVWSMWCNLSCFVVAALSLSGFGIWQRQIGDLRIGYYNPLDMECIYSPSKLPATMELGYVDWVHLRDPHLWSQQGSGPQYIDGLNVTVFEYHGTRCNDSRNVDVNGTVYQPRIAVLGSGAFLVNLTAPTTLRTIHDTMHYGNDPGGVSDEWKASELWRVHRVPLVEDKPGDARSIEGELVRLNRRVEGVQRGVFIASGVIAAVQIFALGDVVIKILGVILTTCAYVLPLAFSISCAVSLGTGTTDGWCAMPRVHTIVVVCGGGAYFCFLWSVLYFNGMLTSCGPIVEFIQRPSRPPRCLRPGLSFLVD